MSMDQNSIYKVDRIAIQSWNGLPRRTRREVRRYAREGCFHPEPVVAKVSIGWANAVLREVSRKERKSERDAHLAYIIFSGIVDLFTGANGTVLGGSLGGWGKYSIPEKRAARRIINLHERKMNIGL
ncbi:MULTISPECIES: hypothetical protein [unclassified Frankia]|uniref:hypothetical protein n=1 Tax=unclassified Frankia TaxID=2632575 RepID=UPI002AD2F307|nr:MULTISPECIES: hypothetical protein [unclassified Frankia]